MNTTNKARKYNSPVLQELLDEITPLEMEQTKVKMQLAARIEDLMHARGWNKSQFADKVKKQPSEITKWLSGTQNLTIDVLTEIAFALGVDVPTLFAERQTSVLYRTTIVVQAEAKQAPINLTTPYANPQESLDNLYRGRGHAFTHPVTPFFEA